MSQSNIIFAYLALAFIMFITMKGELPIYMGFLLSNPVPSPDKNIQPVLDTSKSTSLKATSFSEYSGPYPSAATEKAAKYVKLFAPFM